MPGYRRVHRPFAETYQDNRWQSHGAKAGEDVGLRRSAPVETPFAVQEHGRWYHGERHLPGHRASMYLVRPRDGKRNGGLGRIKDAVTGEGPDVFAIKCGDSRTLMRDRPQRWQWSGWSLSKEQVKDPKRYDKDFRKKDLRSVRDWLPCNAMSRAYRSHYNFKSRRYESLREMMQRPPGELFLDAYWTDGAKHSDGLPLTYRDETGEWYSRVPSDAGHYAGGRPRVYR